MIDDDFSKTILHGLKMWTFIIFYQDVIMSE